MKTSHTVIQEKSHNEACNDATIFLAIQLHFMRCLLLCRVRVGKDRNCTVCLPSSSSAGLMEPLEQDISNASASASALVIC